MEPEQLKNICVKIENTFESFGKSVRIIDLDIDSENNKAHLFLQVAIGYRIQKLIEYKEDIAFTIGIDPKLIDLQIRYDIHRLELVIPFDLNPQVKNADRLTSLYNPISQVEHHLMRIQTMGGNDNFVIFELNKDKNYYIQIAAEKGLPNLHIEAAANTYLEKEYQLDKEKLDRLKSLGWSDPLDKKSNYFIKSHISNDQDRKSIACRIVQTFIDVYDYNLQTEFNITESLNTKDSLKKKIMDFHDVLGKYKRVGVKLFQEFKKKVDEES